MEKSLAFTMEFYLTLRTSRRKWSSFFNRIGNTLKICSSSSFINEIGILSPPLREDYITYLTLANLPKSSNLFIAILIYSSI